MRVTPWGRLTCSRRERRDSHERGARLALEALESRNLLSVAPAVVPPLPAVFLQPIPSLSPLDFPDGTIGLYRHGVAVEEFAPATDSDVDRGNALCTAVAATHWGDELRLGAFTYDIGLQNIVFPDGVTVTGAGKNATRIATICVESPNGGEVFTMNNETVLQNLWLDGQLHGVYQFVVGGAVDSTPNEDVTSYLRSVKITGDSDGIFVWAGNNNQYTVDAFDCEIDTNYDAVALLGTGLNTQAVNLWNCSLNVAQPDPIGARQSNCINVMSGFVGVYNCTLTATGDSQSLVTDGILTYNHGSVVVANTTITVNAPAGLVVDLNVLQYTSVTVIGGQGSGPGGTYTSANGTEIYADAVPSTVVGRHVFYNDSAFDDENPLPNSDDDSAIATDKTALLPGHTATLANVTSYDRGINGIVVDVAGLHGNMTADDFDFKVGNNNSPSTWAAAPEPLSVTVFDGIGSGGSDRVEILWADGAIRNQWLQVTMRATENTALARPTCSTSAARWATRATATPRSP